MNDKFNQFYNTWNGRYAEAEDPNNKYACMDLIFLWCDALGIPRAAVRHEFAREVWEQPNDLTRQYFYLIPNTLTNVSQEGDIIVFNKDVGFPGHVSIGTNNSNILNAVSFDQNWGTPTYSRQVTHYLYKGVYGFLRPKNNVLPDDVWVNKVTSVINSTITPHDKRVQIEVLPKLQ